MSDVAEIRRSELIGCCVGTVLHNFGGSKNRNFEGKQNDLLSMTKQVRNLALKRCNHGYTLDKHGVVVAALTTEQDVAIKCLTQIGFTASEPYKKPKHPESDLILFQIAAPKLYEWAKNWKEPPKRETFNLNKNPTRKQPEVVAPVVVAAPAWDEDFEEEDI